MSAYRILIDGVIFQKQKDRPAGISRVWEALLTQLGKSPLANQIIVLDRGQTAPAIDGIRTQPIWDFNPFYFEAESLYLEEVMRSLHGDLFISTYYTYPENSPCMIVLHDMTPEIMGHDLGHAEWMMKGKAIEHCAGYFSVSNSTKRDFQRLYPQYVDRPVYLIPNACSPAFHPNEEDQIRRFKQTYGIKKPYFYLCGHRNGYKNAILFFKAFDLIENKSDFEILCTGGSRALEPIFKPFVRDTSCHIHYLKDTDLTIAYSGAEALIYPSMYEGFGLPVLEAMQSGCPVIACETSSLPEVAGDAALLVDSSDVAAMRNALMQVQDPSTREGLIQRGYQNARRFTWQSTGAKLVSALEDMADRLPTVQFNPGDPIHKGVRLVHTIKDDDRLKDLRKALLCSIQLLPRMNATFDFAPLVEEERVIQKKMTPAVFKMLETARAHPDSDAYIHYWIGLIYAAREDHSAALKAFQEAIQLGLGSVRGGLLAAREAVTLDHVLTAIKLYEELLAIRPDFEEAYKELGKLQERQKRIKESMHIQRLQIPAAPKLADVDPDGCSISIVLPSKDRPEGLADILESLPAAMGTLSYEVLLYLGGEQTPEVEQVLERHRVDRIFRDEDIFKPGEPFSWSRLMDHGFRQAKGTWVMYASDDIVIHPMAFPLALGEADGDESIGGITFLHRNTVEDYGGIFKDYGFDRIGNWAFINFGIIRKKTYQQIKGFDARFRFYWADVDVCLQVWKAGFRIIPSSFSLVEHINIVDAYRAANSGDRYFADTEAYYNKWLVDAFFKGTDCLAKQRHFLDSSDAAVVCSAAREQEDSARAKSPPLVSAIVSTYNSARFLRGCLDDLLAQDVEGGLEIIVVNSGSEQNEADIVREYQKMHASIVYIETEARESVYAAWNRALEVAQGTFITNANTDDRHAPDALGTMSALLREHPQADVVYADAAVTRDENSTLAKAAITGRFRWPAFDRSRLFQICSIGPQPMWRRSLHDRFGLFDASYESAGDYEFWLRISKHAGFLHLPHIMGLYLEHDHSLEHQNASLSMQEADRARMTHWKKADGPRPKPAGMYLERYTGQAASEGFPLVSVVIPTRNRPEKLKAALESVAAQTYPHLEVLVVNDNGDPIDSVPATFQEHYTVEEICLPSQSGPGAARNAGMRAARGKYIAFLDDDDRFLPIHLVSLVAELESSPDLVAAYTDALQKNIDVRGKCPHHTSDELVFSKHFSAAELQVHNYIPILCLMVRRDVVGENVEFNTDLPALEDWEWLIRLSRVGPFRHLPFVTAEYEVRHGSTSRNMLHSDQIERIYQRIYRENLGSTPDIRAAQGQFYHHMTGRVLEDDLPDLFEDGYFIQAVETLSLLLEAPDISQAIQIHADRLDIRLLELIEINAQTARKDKNPALADGLLNLAACIRTRQLAAVPAPTPSG